MTSILQIVQLMSRNLRMLLLFLYYVMPFLLIEFIFGHCLCGRDVRSLASGMAFICLNQILS
jgi:hypothetical protein